MKKLLLVGILLTVCARVGIAGAPCAILPAPAGWSMIANPCNGGVTPIGVFLPVAPDGTTVYKYTGVAWDIEVCVGGVWDPGVMTLSPGEGAFFYLPGAAPLGFGGVPLAGPNAIALPAGFSIRSAPSGLGMLLFPAAEGDTIYMYNNPANVYEIYQFIGGAWEPAPPAPAVGEAFWVYKTVPALWLQ